MRQAMLDGAFGVSTGLFYIPGAFTPTEEVVEIAKVAASFATLASVTDVTPKPARRSETWTSAVGADCPSCRLSH